MNRGHFIGLHSLDHPNFKKLRSLPVQQQISLPRKQLESITGKKITSFAYPYGAWDERVAKALQTEGFTTAYQLQQKSSPNYPAYTLRRMMVDGRWIGA